ncbi:hypothetical protein A1359_02655 [Methylomonas lenta]|uniref:DUF2934 domain-containing protein n=1 Tax=Methylomonas lenta TaxID=980561 RepID=A0A177NSL2_9GAMM|nr:DUF2934 domain-containing protein [Methylomonas lenta]OAI21068.1 hypothetical protein A1359_02655 [Methylomonas lenta]
MTTKYGLLLNHADDIDLVDLHKRVSVNAYYRAEKRNFTPGHDEDDWQAAELEIARQFRRVRQGTKMNGN